MPFGRERRDAKPGARQTLQNLFKDSQTLSMSGFTVDREISQFYNFGRQEHLNTVAYIFKV